MPHRIWPSASVIIRNAIPVERSARKPNIAAMRIVPTIAAGSAGPVAPTVHDEKRRV
jgi:hypothetical protein